MDGKLGPVLFQLPPKYQYTPERLQQMLQIVNTAFENATVIKNYINSFE